MKASIRTTCAPNAGKSALFIEVLKSLSVKYGVELEGFSIKPTADAFGFEHELLVSGENEDCHNFVVQYGRTFAPSLVKVLTEDTPFVKAGVFQGLD